VLGPIDRVIGFDAAERSRKGAAMSWWLWVIIVIVVLLVAVFFSSPARRYRGIRKM
jgi:hypothetical protein